MMEQLFEMNVTFNDIMDCLHSEECLMPNELEKDLQWMSQDLFDYQPLLNDCMFSGEIKVPGELNTKDVMLAATSQIPDKQRLAVNDDHELEQDLSVLVNPNMAMLTEELEMATAEEVPMTVEETEANPVHTDPPDSQEFLVEESLVSPVTTTVLPSATVAQPTYVLAYRPSKTSVLKVPGVSLTTPVKHHLISEKANQPVLGGGVQKVQIRLMPRGTASNRTNGTGARSIDNIIKGFPLSPPNSDSDGSLSPVRSDRLCVTQTPLSQNFSSQKAKPLGTTTLLADSMPSSGLIILSEEEERTLVSEGYPVPTKWPLTKQEEKILKKIQRKIKNKVSAQESRRKKKDYIESLEKRLESSNHENCSLKKKVEKLEHGNRTLMSQIEQLKRAMQSFSSQTSTYVMVFVLFFAICLGAWSPLSSTTFSSGYLQQESTSHPLAKPFLSNPIAPGQQVPIDANDYKTPNMKARKLLSVADDQEDSADGASCYSSVFSWLSMLQSGSKDQHCEHIDNSANLLPPLEVREEHLIEESKENQTEGWMASSEQRNMPAGVNVMYTSDFITVPVSES